MEVHHIKTLFRGENHEIKTTNHVSWFNYANCSAI